MFLTVSDIPKNANLAIKEKNNIDRKIPKKNKIVSITFLVLKQFIYIFVVFSIKQLIIGKNPKKPTIPINAIFAKIKAGSDKQATQSKKAKLEFNKESICQQIDVFRKLNLNTKALRNADFVF